jgi:hypothetical protein
MPPSGAAIIDPRTVRGLLITQLQTVLASNVSVYDAAEATQVPETTAWCQVVAIDMSGRSRHYVGVAAAPDEATIAVTISVGVPAASSRSDMGAIDTALARVASAVDQVVLTDSTHRVELDRPSYGSDSPGIDDQFLRTGAVTVTGRVFRSSGAL